MTGMLHLCDEAVNRLFGDTTMLIRLSHRISVYGRSSRTDQPSQTMNQSCLIFLDLKPVSQKWAMPIKNWKMALQQLALLFDDQIIR